MISFLEYIIVFVSIVFGYIASEFFNGWGRFLRNRTTIQAHWDYIALTIFFFIIFLDFWWLSYTWYVNVVKNIFSLLSFLATPLIYFFYTILLFPHEQKMAEFNSRAHFQKNNVAMYILFICLMVVSILNEFLFKTHSFTTPENLIRLIAIGICVVFIVFRKKEFMLKLLVVLCYALLTVNFITNR
jgi:hypothetical protein